MSSTSEPSSLSGASWAAFRGFGPLARLMRRLASRMSVSKVVRGTLTSSKYSLAGGSSNDGIDLGHGCEVQLIGFDQWFSKVLSVQSRGVDIFDNHFWEWSSDHLHTFLKHWWRLVDVLFQHTYLNQFDHTNFCMSCAHYRCETLVNV